MTRDDHRPGHRSAARRIAGPRFDAIVGTFGVDSCPPLSLRRSLGWKAMLGLGEPRNAGLADARLAFAEQLRDIRTDASYALQNKVACTRSLAELWHLREPCFSLIARSFGQAEAVRRLAELNPHFA